MINPNDHAWAANHWFPTAEKKGVRRIATIPSHDYFNRAAEKNIEGMADVNCMQINNFSSHEYSLRWVTNDQIFELFVNLNQNLTEDMYSKGAAMAMLLLFVNVAFGQHQHANTDSLSKHDSLGAVLYKYFAFEGHFRSYSMFTTNDGHDPDYFAQGVGGGLAYYSPVIKRFQVGLSGFIIYNVHSSQLATENGLLEPI